MFSMSLIRKSAVRFAIDSFRKAMSSKNMSKMYIRNSLTGPLGFRAISVPMEEITRCEMAVVILDVDLRIKESLVR